MVYSEACRLWSLSKFEDSSTIVISAAVCSCKKFFVASRLAQDVTWCCLPFLSSLDVRRSCWVRSCRVSFFPFFLVVVYAPQALCFWVPVLIPVSGFFVHSFSRVCSRSQGPIRGQLEGRRSPLFLSAILDGGRCVTDPRCLVHSPLLLGLFVWFSRAFFKYSI